MGLTASNVATSVWSIYVHALVSKGTKIKTMIEGEKVRKKESSIFGFHIGNLKPQ